MRKLKAMLRRWLLGDELGVLSNQITIMRLELKMHKQECSSMNYDRWREARKNAQQIRQLALKLAMDDILQARPEEN